MKISSLKVLSIDWDFFFPSTDEYDWGHSEENPIFFEALWGHRAGNIGMTNKKRAIDHILPEERLNGFWDRTLEGQPAFLAIVDSHKQLFTWLKDNDCTRANVVNFDAHHDLGYGLGFDYKKAKPPLNCGNWARLGLAEKLIKSYRVVYPPWRTKDPEDEPDVKAQISTELPPKSHYGAVFICRSSCWTPSWSDDKWLQFIGHFKQWPYLWENKCFAPFAMRARACDMAEARKQAESWSKMLAKMKADRERKADYERMKAQFAS